MNDSLDRYRGTNIKSLVVIINVSLILGRGEKHPKFHVIQMNNTTL